MQMASHTIKVTGVSEELLTLLDKRIRAQHATGRSEYIRELIRRDVLGAGSNAVRGSETFDQLLAPVHEQTRAQGFSEEEIEKDIEAEIREYRSERAARRSNGHP